MLPSAKAGPFTVRLTDQGQLQVLDSSCNVLWTTPQAPVIS